MDLRVHGGELAEEAREDDAARACRRADRERAFERAGRLVCQLARDLLLERDQPLGAAVEAKAGLGRLDPAPRAVEELEAEPLLERPHLQADGRLGHAEPLGRLGERLALDHLAERTKLTRVHNGSLWKLGTLRAGCPCHRQNRHEGVTNVRGISPCTRRFSRASPVSATVTSRDETAQSPRGSGSRNSRRLPNGSARGAWPGIGAGATRPRRRLRARRGRRRRTRGAPCAPGRTAVDADVQLLLARPGTSSRRAPRATRGFGSSSRPSSAAVERTGLRLAALGRGDLHVVDSGDRHRPTVYHRRVASAPPPLEDTLVSGYARLASEAEHRRIDLELRVLDILFAALFGIAARCRSGS